jgi:hypothetical protein
VKAKATPFDALLGLLPARQPKSAGSTVVVSGQKVNDVRQIDAALRDPYADDDWATQSARRLRAEFNRAKDAARYQADRCDPVKMAKRKAWADANPDKVAEYRRRNRERNRERNRKMATDWARRAYQQDPEPRRAARRAWYERNRDKVLAKMKAKRDAARQARQAAQQVQS